MQVAKRMLQSLKNFVLEAVQRPTDFIKQPAIRWIAIVYGSTYVVANCVETTMNRYNYIQRLWVNSLVSKIGRFRDRSRSPRWLCLVLVTVAASFTLPPLVTPWFREQGVPAPDKVAQLVVPCAAQILNTPFYVLGLSLYNHPEHSLQQRWAYVRAYYPSTLLARWARIFPAFGIGGVLNKELRSWQNK